MIKKIYLAAAMLMLSLTVISTSAFSQQNEIKKKTPEELASKISDRMKQNLSLSDNQYEQVYNLMLTKIQDRINNKEKYKSTDKETRKQMKKSSREAFVKDMSGILTPEQMQKFNESKGKYKHKKGNKTNKE